MSYLEDMVVDISVHDVNGNQVWISKKTFFSMILMGSFNAIKYMKLNSKR